MRCSRDAPRLLMWHLIISASHIISVEVDGGGRRGTSLAGYKQGNRTAWLTLLLTEPRESKPPPEIKRWERSSARANNITIWHGAKCLRGWLTYGSGGVWVTPKLAHTGSRSYFQPAMVGDVKPPLGLKISLLITHSPNVWVSASPLINIQHSSFKCSAPVKTKMFHFESENRN